MARVKQVAAAAAKKPPENAPSPAPNPPKTRRPPRRAPPLWKKLRVSRKKSLKLLPAASFRGLMRGFSVTRGGFAILGTAVAALREGCEAHLLDLLEEWGLCALHAKRSTIHIADVSLVRCLRVKRG